MGTERLTLLHDVPDPLEGHFQACRTRHFGLSDFEPPTAASPLLAVGSALIDAAPTPAKEFAVRTLGTADKPILVSSIGVVLVIFSALVGLIAWGRPRIAAVAIALLGIVGVAAALARGREADAIPSIVAGVVGVVALHLLRTRPVPEVTQSSAVDSAKGRSRRRFSPPSERRRLRQPGSCRRIRHRAVSRRSIRRSPRPSPSRAGRSCQSPP